MSPSDAPLPIVSTPTSGDAWLALSDQLLWSINHALNNRLAALGSLVRVLEGNGPGGDPLLSMLGQEVERLDHTLGLLRLMPREAGAGAEPVLLTDLLPQVIALHRLQSDAGELRFDADGMERLLPVLIGRSSLVRALLLLLAEADRQARETGTDLLALRCRGDEDEVAVVVELPVGAAAAPGGGEAEAAHHAVAVATIEGLLIGSGGRLVRQAAGSEAGRTTTLELRLPTLTAVRRRQRSAEGAE